MSTAVTMPPSNMNDIDSIEVFTNADIHLNQNLICPRGFDTDLSSFNTMLYIARTNNCNIIVRTNNKWYLKSGLYKPTREFVSFVQRKKIYTNTCLYLLKFKDNTLFEM